MLGKNASPVIVQLRLEPLPTNANQSCRTKIGDVMTNKSSFVRFSLIVTVQCSITKFWGGDSALSLQHATHSLKLASNVQQIRDETCTLHVLFSIGTQFTYGNMYGCQYNQSKENKSNCLEFYIA